MRARESNQQEQARFGTYQSPFLACLRVWREGTALTTGDPDSVNAARGSNWPLRPQRFRRAPGPPQLIN